MEQPAWLAAAWAEFGVREVEGSADSPNVASYFREAGHPEIIHDETAWCAAFAGAMLARGGQWRSGSLLARSYLAWGRPLEVPVPGAIVVLERGNDPNAGHVGFLVGRDAARVFLLGGNQSGMVSVAAFAASRVLAYRWPEAAARQSASPAPAVEGGIFERALGHVLAMEGGYSDDPYDPGGPTNKGITLDDFARWKGVSADATSRAKLIEDLKRIPDDTLRAIYLSRYWRPAGCEKLAPAVAVMHFDAAVNHGTGTAVRMLQQAAGAMADGDIGPETANALRRAGPDAVLNRYAEIRRARYRALASFWRFGRGWLKRVDATLAAARTELAIPNNADTTSTGVKPMTQDIETNPNAKWWAQSRTIWGALVTAAAAVVPVLGPLVGIELSGDVVRQAGEQTISAIQAMAGLFGTLLTIYGRINASAPLVRRVLNVRV